MAVDVRESKVVEETGLLEEELLQRNKELAALNAIAQTVSQSLNLDQILDEALDKALELMGVELGLIYLFREETDDFWPVVHRGISQDILREVAGFKMGQGLSGQAAQSGEALVVADVSEDSRNLAPSAKREGFRAFAAVPLRSKDEVVGVMTLTTKGDHQFLPQDLGVLNSIGNQIGVAIENARLYEELQRELTERKRAEEALRESEGKYGDLFENANDLIQSVDIEGKFIYVNRKWLEVLEYTKDEVEKLTLMDVLREDQIPHCMELFEKVSCGEAVNQVETVFVSKNGKEIPVEGNVNAQFKDGKFVACRGIFRNITERKQAEEATKLAYAELDQIFNTAADGMRVVDKEFNVLRINETFSTLSDISEDEAVGKKCYEVFRGPICHTPNCPLTRILGGEERVEYEVEKERNDGIRIPCIVTATPFRGPNGELIGIVEDFKDITERKRAEWALGERVKELTCLYTVNRDVQEDLSIDELCRRVIEHLVPAMQFPEITVPVIELDDRRFTSERYTEGLSHGLHAEIRGGGEARGHLWVYYAEDRSFLIPEEQNLVNGVAEALGLWLERKRAEEALRESEEKYRTILENIEDGYYEVDIAGNLTFFNDALCRIFGYPEDELMGMNNRQYMDDETAKAVYQTFNAVYRTGKATKIFDYEIIRKDGTRRSIQASVSLISGSTGEPAGFRGIIRDITERKQAEEATKLAYAELDQIFNTAADGMRVVDKEFNVLRINETFSTLSDISEDEAVGKKCYEVFRGPMCHTSNCPLTRILGGEERVEYEEEKERNDHIKIPCIVTATPFRGPGGDIIGIIEDFKDITERKRAEEEVQRHLERLEALREIDRAISSTLDLSEVLDIILEQLERVIPYSSAAIFLLSDDIAKITAGRGFPDMKQVMGVSFPAEEDPLTRQLLQEGRPLILVDAQADERFQARGGTEYVRSWIGVPLIVRGEAIGFLTIDHREPGVYDEESGQMALAVAIQAAIAIENARAYEELKALNLEVIAALTRAVEAKDPYTAGHSTGVTEYALTMAERMGLPSEEIETLRMASLLHDVGKIGIPGSVLNKPSRLTSAEFIMIQSHPVISAEIIEKVKPLASAVPIIRHHHERWDGTGYPDGLKGEDIPLMARILAVADGFEAMTSDRPYRGALTEEETLAILKEGAGSQWDPQVVEVFLRIYESGTIS